MKILDALIFNFFSKNKNHIVIYYNEYIGNNIFFVHDLLYI